MNKDLPKELVEWLNTLPEKDRLRETEIAIRNLSYISRHLNGPNS